jgi:lysophospholipase L1-like esterase
MTFILAACSPALPVLAAEAGTSAIEKLDPNFAAKDASGEWLWYDAKGLTVEGKGWTDTEWFYDRLPARAKGVVPDSVWSLSRHSAGLCVRFVTDTPKISARWKVLNSDLAMPHMPATGVSGLDLYVARVVPTRNDNGVWRWIGNGRPAGQTTETLLAGGIPEGSHEYVVYLPLYNGTESLDIGVVPTATISKAPAHPAGNDKPILFYGTSITHGGCASRPGMAYPAILGRRLDRPTINLGFSGNGKMEMEMEALIAEVDAAVYVLDCLPNMSPEMVTERIEPFVTALRKARPGTPIVLVENIAYQAGAFLPASKAAYADKNAALRAAYERLTGNGIGGLHYVPGETLLGADGEATVDGTHPTDLGFLRMADALDPVLRKALEGK